MMILNVMHLSLNDPDEKQQMVHRLCYGAELEAAFKERFERAIEPPLQLAPYECQLPTKEPEVLLLKFQR